MVRDRDAPLSVELPSVSERTSWAQVGAIAAVGFAVGILWPRVAGIRLGPSAPATSEPAAFGTAAPATPSPPASQTAPGPTVIAPPATPSGTPAASVALASNAGPPLVTVKSGVVTTCKTSDGDPMKGKACGTISFDTIAVPRLKRLAQCPTAAGAEGKLSVIFILDFERNKIQLDVGRSSTVGNLDTFGSCLRTSLENVSLSPVEHDHPRYNVWYTATFGARDPAARDVGKANPAPASTEAASPAEPAADQTAEVVWEVAIVRDTPRTGQVVARLQRGTKLKVGGGQQGWFLVHYGATFGSEGWVYRGAIGK